MTRIPNPRLTFLAFALLSAILPAQQAADPILQIDAADLKKRINFLASDEMKGRETGSPEIARCGDYIAKEFESYGFKPAQGKEWFQPCKVGGRECRNVLGVLPGRDPSLRKEYVVIGAHYDHVGMGSFGSRGGGGQVHNGADDNGSGTATMLEIAQAFSKKAPKRSLLFMAFTGEEMGLLGSKYYCDHPVIPLEKTVAMVNLDMVGRSTNNYLFVGGIGSGKGFDKILDAANKTFKFDLETKPGGLGPSDMESFYRKKVPVLFFFTNEHPDYHTASDDPEKINFPETERVGRLAFTIAQDIANRDKRFEYQAFDGLAVPDSMMAGRGGKAITLGVDWDPASSALKIRGFKPGSAAEKAGIKVGDVVLAVDGKEVKKPSDVSSILAWKKLRDSVAVSVQRGEKRIKYTLSL